MSLSTPQCASCLGENGSHSGVCPHKDSPCYPVVETRITDPRTGGQKGSKLERFDLIPAEPLEALARVYGIGAQKYADDNWRKGYSWRLSFAALMRHAWAFWRGEDTDAESGQPHLAHAAWHCFTLLWFMQRRPALDDRPSKKPETT